MHLVQPDHLINHSFSSRINFCCQTGLIIKSDQNPSIRRQLKNQIAYVKCFFWDQRREWVQLKAQDQRDGNREDHPG